ncbi:hypothetical protein [Mangrovimonas aestuarii]|uniref:hypothetical protein n=1 Tax=Mangrovimonas aestuarii TaxID=3018443 RepID=UPI0023782F9E|nr:hypothetical protein [Mangrovimonas aestuarii]
MKTSILLSLLLIYITGCQNNSKSQTFAENNTPQPTIIKNHSLKGSWELVSWYNYQDNKIVDTFLIDNHHRQIKMYTDTRVMWSKQVPTDSTEWYGFGAYTVTDGSLTETLEYGSASMNEIIKSKEAFSYELILDENKYSQIELDSAGNRLYSENYKRID